MWRESLINEVSYRGFIDVIVAIASTPGGSQWWSHGRIALGNDISNLVDDELAQRPEGAPSWTDIFPHLRLENTNDKA